MVSNVGSASSFVSQMFSRLDSKNQGSLEKSDLVSAFQQIDTSGDSAAADQVFTALDNDSDGKVTSDEFASGLNKLHDALDSQFNQMRMQGHHGGAQGMAGNMPPPPPPQNDAGFSKDELQSQLDEIGSSDSRRSSLIASVVDNFSSADSDGDGKVSFTEAQAFQQSSQQSGSTSGAEASSSATEATAAGNASNPAEAQLLKRMMALLHAYGGTNPAQQENSLSSQLSASA